MSRRTQRLDILTAAGLAQSDRDRELRQGQRDAATTNRWAGALSSLIPAATNAAGAVYDTAGDAAVNDATALAASKSDVVDQQEANDIVEANFKEPENAGILDNLMKPVRSKARAAATTALSSSAKANTATREAKAAAEKKAADEALERARRDARESFNDEQAFDAKQRADEIEEMKLGLKEREVSVKEKPKPAKPGPSPEAIARREKQDKKLDLEIAALEGKGSDATPLRDEFNKNPAVKEYNAAAVEFDKMSGAAAAPGAAGDIALIFSFMKLLDPGSVVKETEFANAQNATGVPDQIRNQWNKLKNGERLNPDQRKDFLAQAAGFLAAQKKARDAAVSRYSKLATKKGAAAEDVVDVAGADAEFDEFMGAP